MPKPLTRHERATVARAARVSADFFAIFRPLIFMPTRSKIRIATARQVAMYLAHVAGGVPVNRLRHAFKRDATTIMHNIQHIEDLREEGSVFDVDLTRLEGEFYNLGNKANETLR